MFGLGVLALLVGVGDLVATGIDGETATNASRRAGLASVAVLGMAGLVVHLFRPRDCVADAVPCAGGSAVLLFTLTAAAAAICWLWLHVLVPTIAAGSNHEAGRRRSLLSLGWLALAGIGLGAATAVADYGVGGPGLSLAREQAVAPTTLLVVGGGALAQVATGNAIVRHVLRIAGRAADAPTSRLRAGRVIGILERLFVFGALASGNGGIAAAVVAAKGLLRYPEVAAAARRPTPSPPGVPLDVKDDPVPLTEYLLVGTLTSVLVAAAPALAV